MSKSRASAVVMMTRGGVVFILALAVVAGAAGSLANVAALGDVDDMPASMEKVKYVRLYRSQMTDDHPNRSPMCLERIEVKHRDGRKLEQENDVKVTASSAHAQPCEEEGKAYSGCQQKTTTDKVCAMWSTIPRFTEADSASRRRLLSEDDDDLTAAEKRDRLSSAAWWIWHSIHVPMVHPKHNFCRSWTADDQATGVKWCRYGTGQEWETCASLEDTYTPDPDVLVNGQDGSTNGQDSDDEHLGYSYFCLEGGREDGWIEIELATEVAVVDIESVVVTVFKGFKGPDGETLTSDVHATLFNPDAFMTSGNEISVYLLDEDKVQISGSYAGDSQNGVITFNAGTKEYEIDSVPDDDYFTPLCVDQIELRAHRSFLPPQTMLKIYGDAGQELSTTQAGASSETIPPVDVRVDGHCALISKIEVTASSETKLFDGVTIVAKQSATVMFDATLRGNHERYDFEFPIDCVGQFENAAVDEGTGEWTWGTRCSAQCGYGTQNRRYKVLTPAMNGGAKCRPHGREIENDRVTCAENDDDARRGTCFCDFDSDANSSDPCFSEPTDCDPATVECDAPVVVIGAQATRIASRAFDFRISVTHPLCGQRESNECFAEVPNGRIRCDVKMSKIGADCSAGYSESYLPCRTWNDFTPRKVGLVYPNGEEEYGEHQFQYNCYVVEYPGGASDPAIEAAASSSTRVFNLTEGCDTLMPISADEANDPNGELAKILLFGSHAFTFNNAECTPHKIQDVKEAIFRRYDTDPQDGVLTYDELVAARQVQNADADILTVWEEIESANEIRDSLRLTLGQVMQSNVMPISCPQPSNQPISFTVASQPIWDEAQRCEEDSQSGMTVTWQYGADTTAKMQAGDFVCVYVDGILYEQAPALSSQPTSHAGYEMVKASLYALMKIEDKRPVSGDFAGVQESLVAQFTFDNTVGDSSIDSVLLPVPGQTRVPIASFSFGTALARTDCDETLAGPNGVGYRGCQVVNRDGKTCRRWDDLDDLGPTSTFHHAPGEKYDAGAHNFCRTSTRNDAETIWCYNEDNTGWAYCDPVPQDPPKDGHLRLVGGSNQYIGRVEVYSTIRRAWGTVCGDSFDNRDAKVVCRQLGYEYDEAAGADFSTEAGKKWGMSLQGSGAILLDDADCSGRESSLFACPRRGVLFAGKLSLYIGLHNCQHAKDVVVKCTPPTNTAEERKHVDACAQGEGKSCFQPTPKVHGLKYVGDSFVDSVAFTTWIYIPSDRSRCPDTTVKAYPNYHRRNLIFSLEGKSAGGTYRLDFGLDDMEQYCKKQATGVNLNIKYGEPSSNSESTSWTQIPETIPLAEGKWHLIGFALDPSGVMKMFAYDSMKNGDMQTKEDWPRNTLLRMPTVRMLETIGVQYDDARVFTGKLSQGTIDSMLACGRQTFCAERARATPSTRRVICAFADLEANLGKPATYSCTGGVYFDGAAIDFTATMGMGGVTFSFRDTSSEENAFEITRIASNVVDSSIPETVVMVQGELVACGLMFSSITYMDLEAGLKPNLDWRYYVVTKTAEGKSFSSLPFRFKSPWFSVVEGNVYAGSTTTPVPRVRICVEFKSAIESELKSQAESFDNPAVNAVNVVSLSSANTTCAMSMHANSTNATDGVADATGCVNATTAANDTSVVNAPEFGGGQSVRVNMAKYKRVRHSNVEKSARAYVLTDGKIQKSAQKVLIGNKEYARVDLGRWSSIETIEVCVDGLVPRTSKPPRVFVLDYEPEGAEYHGHECKYLVRDEVPLYACEQYVCVGASLTSFHGQFVTVVGVNATNVTEIRALGKETRCKYSAITDQDGQYEIELKDRTGVIPIKTEIHIGAYKEEVSPETTEMLLDSMFTDEASISKISKSEPFSVLLVLRDVGGSNSSAASNATRGEAPSARATPLGSSRKLAYFKKWKKVKLPPPPPPPSPPTRTRTDGAPRLVPRSSCSSPPSALPCR